jgi:hypothetical protein
LNERPGRRSQGRRDAPSRQSGSQRLPPTVAAAKNAGAVDLLSKGKFRQALSALNDAIYAAPDYPHSYATRARVFERLGMMPQADADRRRAHDLTRSGGYSEDEVFAEPAVRRRESRRPVPKTVTTRSSSGQRGRATNSHLPVLSETAVVLIAMLGLAATAVAAYVAVGAIRDADINLNVFDFESFRESDPEPTAADTPGVTAEPTPPPATPPSEALIGKPFSFSNVQSAWQGKGLTVALGTLSPGFSGLKAAPFDVTLSRGGASSAFILAIYPDRAEPSIDWNLGGVPSTKDGRRAPAFERGWYNSNVILLLRSGNPDIANDAKAAFLDLGG